MEDLTKKNERELLPSQRPEYDRQVEAKRTQDNERRLESLKQDFGRVFATEEGKRVLSWLCNRCGFGRVILSATPDGKIDQTATTFAAMELNLYLEIRRHVPIEILKPVEFGEIKPSGTLEEET